MKKIFFMFYLLFIVLYARDNPFEPLLSPKESSHKPSDDNRNYFENFDFKLPSTARILKNITVTYQNIDGSLQTQTLDIDQNIDWHYPLRISQQNALLNDQAKYYVVKPFEFFIKNNELYIHTTDKIQRNFVLPDPYRIIIDIDRKDKNINEALNINRKYFTKISIGTHNNFYRIVITLDGQYQYKITQENDYYVLSLQ